MSTACSGRGAAPKQLVFSLELNCSPHTDAPFYGVDAREHGSTVTEWPRDRTTRVVAFFRLMVARGRPLRPCRHLLRG